MNTIYIDKKDATISTNKTQLFINSQQIPLKIIDTVVFAGKYTLNSSDILQLSRNSINIILVSSNLANATIITSANSKNAELKQLQYKASLLPLNLAKEILIEKIKTHNSHLSNLGFETKDNLTQINQAKSLDELLGIEGSYSRYYFSKYFTLFPKKLAKGTRSKQPPKDAVNAMLSFTYTLFYNFITIRLLGFGFEPSIGFLHRPFRSHNALSSDILECYRASINQFVYELFQNTLNINDFTKNNGVYLKYKSRSKFWQKYKQFYQEQQPKIDQTIANIRAKL